MATAPVAAERPDTPEEAAELLRTLGEAGRPVRIRGGGTKSGWAWGGEPVEREVVTGGLARVTEHNEGDFTAILEAGVPLARAQQVFGAAGQMLALDPPLGAGEAATLGGVLAAGDSGPLRHRYGTMRDLVVGVTVALSDGSLAKAGGKVIKNVAGYDLGKLFTGSFGTLGLVVSIAVRLHPRPDETATAWGASADATKLSEAVAALARLPLEADCLDVAWGADGGRPAGGMRHLRRRAGGRAYGRGAACGARHGSVRGLVLLQD